jgi:hypothetical protein
MGSVNPNKAGLVLGSLIGGWHVLWALLVAVGWAQWVINFVFWMHFLKPPYVVGAFHPGVALILVLVTTSIGYVMGYILGLLWNWIHR